MKAAEDFLEMILHAHILAACDQILRQKDITDVKEIAAEIIKSYITLTLDGHDTTCNDGVYLYACDLLTLGMIWMGFHDAIREGDGQRVMTYWKFLLPVFKILGRKNYAIEAITIQLQCHHHLSERQSAELVWSRFINSRGGKGCNIPCDLHLEHLNRRLKTLIRNLGSNITGKTVVRASKSIGVIHHICELFEHETNVKRQHDKHPIPKYGKDFEMVLEELKTLKVFTQCPGRDHTSIHVKKRLLHKFSRVKYLDWVKKHIY